MNEAALTPESVVPVAPGAQLAAARESCGLSVADVAQQLKLSPRQVAALESGDYTKLPGNVFVRGFVRNYARLVKLDAAQLLAAADRAMPQAAPAVAQVSLPADIPFPVARTAGWRKFALAALAVLVLLASIEFYREDTQERDIKALTVESPAPKVVAEISQPANIEPGVSSPPLPVADASITAPPSRPVSRVPDPRPPAEVKPVRGEQVVRLRFARESWVEIRDGNGRKIFSQLNSRGTEQVVSGLAPLSIVVGNAKGVQLMHNEQPVDLAPYTQVDVARLTLE